MLFTEEDGILNAVQARLRSESTADDSIRREAIRKIMNYVRLSSGYGYTKSRIMGISPLESLTKNPDIKEIIENLGFQISESTDDTYGGQGQRFTWDISW